MHSRTSISESGPSPSGNPQDPDWHYSGRELESMYFAVNYHRWILDVFRPYLGKRILEIGAGTGSFSRMLLESRPEFLTSLEPSANMFPELARTLAKADTLKVATAHQSTLEGLVQARALPVAPDSVAYINVLEHIEDDEQELRSVYSVLQPGGRIFIFVPAMRWLMSRMDLHLGHYRRYTKPELVDKCSAAGFRILRANYFDAFGIVPWWLIFRLMKSERIEPGAVRIYDRTVIPVERILESFISPPLGKNIILVGEKPLVGG